MMLILLILLMMLMLLVTEFRSLPDPFPYWGAADRYKILRVVNYKALHDLAIIDNSAYRCF